MLKNIHIFILAVIVFALFTILSVGFGLSLLFTFLLITAFILFNVFNLRRSLFVKTISRIKTNEKIVFLTFDDGPNKEATNDILDILRIKRIPACFFCIGTKMIVHWELTQRIHQEGHVIGIHTMNHQIKDTFVSSQKYTYELRHCMEIIKKITGYKPLLFRPPFGVSNPGISKVIKNFKLTCLGWNIRTYDTQAKNKEILLSRIENRLKPGAIILLHDLEITALALPEIIQIIHEKGYNILSLQQFIEIGAYE